MTPSSHAKSDPRLRSDSASGSSHRARAPQSQRDGQAQVRQNGPREGSQGGSFWSLSGTWHT